MTEITDHLADVLVLVEALLGHMAFLQVDTQLQVLGHDRLVNLLPCPVLLTLDHIVESVKGRLLLTNFNEL